MQTWKVLNAAADRIARYGWYQENGYCGPVDSVCASMAIGRVAGSGRLANAARCVFARALGDNESWSNIYKYNDAPGRTADEVIAMLRAVAASEKARVAQFVPQPEAITA